MSVLYLVRHAQASFFAENYDELSPLGRIQARKLGEDFARRGIIFDSVVTGPAVRQRHTAEIAGNVMQSAGLSWPEPTVVDDLNEHAGDQLLKKPLEAHFERHPELRDLETAYRAARHPEEIQKTFQRLFEAVIDRWTQGEFTVPGVESWDQFHERVGRGLRALVAHEDRGRTILAVSSVGPISAVLQKVLKTSVPVALEMGWRLRNCSVTTFVFSSERITLDGFNSVAHLDHLAEVTYR